MYHQAIRARNIALVVLLVGLGLPAQPFQAQAQEGDPWLPAALDVITPENAGALTQLAQWGLGSLTGVALSPDGRTLAAGSSVGVWLYDTGNLDAPPRLVQGHTGEVSGVLFGPVGNVLASASCGEPIRLWEAATGSQCATLAGSALCPALYAFTPDGALLASASNRHVVELWAVDGADQTEPAVRMEGHEATVYSVAFSADGRLMASGAANEIRVWDAATGAELAQLTGFEGPANALAFAPAGRILAAGTGSPDNAIRLWDVADPAAAREIALLALPSRAAVGQVAFNADGTLFAASGGNMVQVWEFATGGGAVDYMPFIFFEGHADDIGSLRFFPQQDRLVTSSADQTIRVWDVQTGEQVAMLAGYMDSPVLAYSPDGSLIAVAGEYRGLNEAVVLLDAATGQVVRVMESALNETDCIAFSPDGALVAAGQGWLGRGGVKLWDVQTGELRAHFADVVRAGSLAFSPDGALLAVAPLYVTPSEFYVLDLQTGERVMTLGSDLYEGDVTSVAFSPDGATLVSTSLDQSAHLWDVATGAVIAALEGHESAVMSALYSPDGSLLVTGDWGNDVWVWNPATAKPRLRLDVGAAVRTMAFSPGGELLAIGGRFRIVEVWNLRASTRLATLQDPLSDIRSVAFSPDGRVLAGAGSDGVVRLWGVPVD